MIHEDEQAGLIEIPFTVDSLGSAISHLREHDHSISPDDLELVKHTNTLDQAVQFFGQTMTSNPDIQKGIAQILQDINNTKRGYAYRANAHLPGLGRQFLLAREAMVKRQDFGDHLTSLAAQPDSQELLQQLRLEYSLFESILDAGGDLDIDALRDATWDTFQGINLMPEWELEARLALIDDLEQRVKGSEELAAVQGRPGLIPLMLDTLSKARINGQLALASSLETSLGWLSMEGKIKLPGPEFDHNDRVVELTKNGDVGGRFHEVMRYLCQATGLDLETTLQHGVSKLDLQRQQVELQAQIDTLRVALGVESIWDYVPLILDIRQKKEAKRFADIIALGEQSKNLRNRIELADSINKAREYLLSLRSQ